MHPTCVAILVAICVTIRQLALLPIRVPMFVPPAVTIRQRPLQHSMCVCVFQLSYLLMSIVVPLFVTVHHLARNLTVNPTHHLVLVTLLSLVTT